MKGQQMLPNLRRLRRRGERGFTLIELLVVIVILGILAAVVVFSVRGANDKGLGSAVAIDERTIRTAEEAYCAQKGEYATGQQLADAQFLSEPPKYHNVTAVKNGGPCNGWRYTIDTTPLAAGGGSPPPQPPPDPTTQGRWAYTKTQPDHRTAYVVRLADGKVLAGGYNKDYTAEAAKVWDPVTDTWTSTDTPPTNFLGGGGGSTAFLLTDDPKTPESECKGVTAGGVPVDNCGKVFVHGRHLFDPKVAPGTTGQWYTVPNPGPACNICNDGPANHNYVQMMPSVGQCGTETCGKIYILAGKGGGTVQQNYDMFDPKDNSYKPIPLPQDPQVRYTAQSGGPLQLVDGRVFLCCLYQQPAVFFNPVSLKFTQDSDATPPPPDDNYGRFPDGPVLPNGGIFYGGPGGRPRSSGIYTPVPGGPGTWKKVASCIPGGLVFPFFPRDCIVVGSLSDGRVMAIESEQGTSIEGDYKVRVYNPATEAWSQTAPLNNPRSYNRDAVLLDPAGGPCGAYCNKMLVVGVGSAEVYTPCPGDPLFVGPVACKPV